MNVSIIGPEGSGKTTFATQHAKRAAFGRPIYFIGELKTEFKPLDISEYNDVTDAVVIIDDANAFLDSYEIYTKDKKFRKPVVMSRHRNRLNIFIFHSFDDAVKFFFRLSRYIFVSRKYRDSSYLKNQYIAGITPKVVGKGRYEFWSFKRY